VPEVDNCLTTGELHKLMEQHGVTHLSQGASVCVCAVWLCVCVCCVAVCVCVCVCVCVKVCTCLKSLVANEFVYV
jgi:hypothetical protein